jgi:hypothetical protein
MTRPCSERDADARFERRSGFRLGWTAKFACNAHRQPGGGLGFASMPNTQIGTEYRIVAKVITMSEP